MKIEDISKQVEEYFLIPEFKDSDARAFICLFGDAGTPGKDIGLMVGGSNFNISWLVVELLSTQPQLIQAFETAVNYAKKP